MPRRPRALVWLVGAALGIGCSFLPFAPRSFPECPGQWVDTREIPGAFLLRESVRLERGEWSFSLQLVAQKRGDELLLLGLHPLGAKLFTVRQRGMEVEVDALPASVLEVPPLNFLRDLHRVRFLSVGKPPEGDRAREERGGTEIRERYVDGALRVRSFERLDGDPSGRIEIDYSESGAVSASRAGSEGPRIVLDNGWCGYRAEITLLAEETLP